MGAASHFGRTHPLAAVARRLCRTGHGAHVGSGWLGGVACGRHWEQAIRADERVAVLFDLPAELTDELTGDLVAEVVGVLSLTGSERLVAAQRVAQVAARVAELVEQRERQAVA